MFCMYLYMSVYILYMWDCLMVVLCLWHSSSLVSSRIVQFLVFVVLSYASMFIYIFIPIQKRIKKGILFWDASYLVLRSFKVRAPSGAHPPLHSTGVLYGFRIGSNRTFHFRNFLSALRLQCMVWPNQFVWICIRLPTRESLPNHFGWRVEGFERHL